MEKKKESKEKHNKDKRKAIIYKHTVGSLIILTLREIKIYVASVHHLFYFIKKTVFTNSPHAEKFISKT